MSPWDSHSQVQNLFTLYVPLLSSSVWIEETCTKPFYLNRFGNVFQLNESWHKIWLWPFWVKIPTLLWFFWDFPPFFHIPPCVSKQVSSIQYRYFWWLNVQLQQLFLLHHLRTLYLQPCHFSLLSHHLNSTNLKQISLLFLTLILKGSAYAKTVSKHSNEPIILQIGLLLMPPRMSQNQKTVRPMQALDHTIGVHDALWGGHTSQRRWTRSSSRWLFSVIRSVVPSPAQRAPHSFYGSSKMNM